MSKPFEVDAIQMFHVLYRVQQHAISNLGIYEIWIYKREEVMALQAFHKT